MDAGRLVATGEPGTVMYGPYLRLPKGDYDARWTGGVVESPGEITFVVTADAGQDELARVVIPASKIGGDRAELAHLRFTLDHARDAVELAVFSVGGARVALDEVVLERR